MRQVDQTTPRDVWNDQLFAVACDESVEARDERHGAGRLQSAVVIVERSALLRDCLIRSLAACAPGEIVGYSSLSEQDLVSFDQRPAVALLSLFSLNEEETEDELAFLRDIGQSIPVIVFAKNEDPDAAMTALGRGAKGFISMEAGFETLIQVLRFIAAGGEYVSPQCLVAAQRISCDAPEPVALYSLTERELAVTEGILDAQPNKLIAWKLNIQEGTVKVHVRNIMKKLNAKNRTDIAIKCAESMPALPFRR